MPAAITLPFDAATGGFSFSSFTILSKIYLQGLRESPSLFKYSFEAFSQMSLNPDDFFSADWAKEKGLFMEVFDSIEKMDEAVENLANRLKNYNPEALSELKKIIWKNTEHWDKLLTERAEISGRLVLSEFTKKTLNEI